MPAFPGIPPVAPLPGGNQYGGAPINPFQSMPVAPKLAGGIPAPVSNAIPMYNAADIRNESKPITVASTMGPHAADSVVTARRPVVPQYVPPTPDTAPPPALVKPGQIPSSVVQQPDPIGKATNAPVTYPEYPIVTGPPPAPAPAYQLPNLAQTAPRPLPNLSYYTAPNTSTAAPSSLSGGLGNVMSDIKNKTDIKPAESSMPLQTASKWQPLGAANRVEIMPGGQRHVVMGEPPPQPAPQASFEGGPNPMMGLGAYQQPAPAPQPTSIATDANAQVQAGQQQMPLNFDYFHKLDESDERGKKDIRPVSAEGAPEDYKDAWKGTSLQAAMEPPPQAQPQFSMSAPPMRVVAPEAVPQADLRPAQGYSYQYKDPQQPGAAPGTHYGPMAQDLEKTPAGASVVSTNPQTGLKQIDTDRLSLVNSSAISDLQRKQDELQAMLDYGYAKQQADTGPRVR